MADKEYFFREGEEIATLVGKERVSIYHPDEEGKNCRIWIQDGWDGFSGKSRNFLLNMSAATNPLLHIFDGYPLILDVYCRVNTSHQEIRIDVPFEHLGVLKRIFQIAANSESPLSREAQAKMKQVLQEDFPDIATRLAKEKEKRHSPVEQIGAALKGAKVKFPSLGYNPPISIGNGGL